MIITEEWVLTELAGEYVAVPVGENANEFHGIVRLNETGKEIWDGLAEGLTEEEIAEKMVKEYDRLSKDKALQDIKKVIIQLKAKSLLEG